MPIDWERPANRSSALRLRRLTGSAKTAAGALESTSRLSAAERLERLEAGLRGGNADRKLAEQVIIGARQGLAKVAEVANAHLNLREAVALEAVVLTDGTRPSLRVVNGFVDDSSAEASGWEQELRSFRDPIRRIIASTGKVVAPLPDGFAGTAFMVADNLVMTNRHVAEAIATQRELGVWELRWPGETWIDFVAENENAPISPWAVDSVVWAGPDAIGNAPSVSKLDLALLSVAPPADPPPGRATPKPLRLDAQGTWLSPEVAVYAAGIAGRPRRWDGSGPPPVYQETQQVIAELFQDKFGVKRLAPGRVSLALGTIAGGRGRVFAHDCSTLAGNSGSLISALAHTADRVLGVHFAGISRIENYALALAAVRQDLPSGDGWSWSAAAPG